MRSRLSGVCASCIIAIISLPVFAQQDGSFWMDADRASVKIGGFAADFKTNLRLSLDALGIGTKISLEDDLGMDSDRVLARIDGYYRFSRRRNRCCPTTRPRGADVLACSSLGPVLRPTTMPRGQAMTVGLAARKQSITHKRSLPVFHTELLQHHDPRIVLTGVMARCQG